MRRKTILHLTGMTGTKFGGLERYFVELASLCVKKGYQSIFQYNFLPESSDYLLQLEKLGAKIVVYDTNGNLFQVLLKIASVIHSIKPKVVQTHFMSYRLRFVVGVVGRLLRVPKTIATIHSNLNLRKRTKNRWAFNYYHHVLPVSAAVSQNLIEGGVNPKIVSTHYLGLFGDREPSKQIRFKIRREFEISEDAVVIGCIAFDTPFKGLDILLSALSKVVQKYSSVHLILVGVDPYKSSLPDLVAKLGLLKNVHWAGIRDNGWRVLNAADVYVQSSRYGEGLSLAIMEAMALKLPVIATRVAGQQEAVIEGETGFLAEPNNVDSLSMTLKRLIGQPKSWKPMGQAGYERYLLLFRGENSIKTLVERYYEV